MGCVSSRDVETPARVQLQQAAHSSELPAKQGNPKQSSEGPLKSKQQLIAAPYVSPLEGTSSTDFQIPTEGDLSEDLRVNRIALQSAVTYRPAPRCASRKFRNLSFRVVCVPVAVKAHEQQQATRLPGLNGLPRLRLTRLEDSSSIRGPPPRQVSPSTCHASLAIAFDVMMPACLLRR